MAVFTNGTRSPKQLVKLLGLCLAAVLSYADHEQHPC